ncbi:MAG: zinc-finger domain-containing protein [Gammaproteobacteria bacterium]|nr:zinc-finger domain-containing protein [Gammaproteobacteria bacterium]MCW8888720.1 zinc-finger domain-containing protein [Gammaproteobacteria bacterium]
MSQAQAKENQVKTHFQVRRSDLPLHCPMPQDSKWDAHPRVFLDIEKSGEAKCPYCGAEYQLTD